MRRPYYGFVYLTTNLANGKRYIGQTTKDESKAYFGSGKAIKQALVKYGTHQFTREVLIYAFNKVDLDSLEMQLIADFGALDARLFYNIAEGGKTTRGFTGKSHTEEHKESVRQFMLTQHPNKGKQFSSEVRKNMSMAKMGNKSKSTPEGRAQARQLGLANKGRKRTAEQREAISKSQAARPSKYIWTVQTPDGIITVEKLSLWVKGKGLTYDSLVETLTTGVPHAKTGLAVLSRITRRGR